MNECSLNEYCEKVRKWQIEYHLAQLAEQSRIQKYISDLHSWYQQQSVLAAHQSAIAASTSAPATTTSAASTTPVVPARGRLSDRPSANFILPPVWKRVVAELMDFVILLTFKVLVFIWVYDDYEKLLIQLIIQLRESNRVDASRFELSMNADDFAELLLWTMIYRFSACLYETLFLTKGFRRSYGGATPGKLIMGLRVVSFDEILSLPEDRIQLISPKCMSFWNGFVRAFIKNFSSAFMFPAALTIYLFDNRRPVYDILCNSVVVDSHHY